MTVEFLSPHSKRADGATLASLFVLVLFMIPAKLVINGLPIMISPSDAVSFGIVLCWFCAQLTTTLGAAKGRNAVRTALFLYVVSVLVTYGYASAGYLPSDELGLADHALITMFGLTAVALVVCDGVRSPDRLDFLLKVVVVTGTIVASLGVLQFLVNIDLTKYLVLPGLHYSTDLGFVDSRNNLKRVASTTTHPIEFGVLCVMILPLSLHYALRSRGRSSWGWWLCGALIGTGLMFSVSRSAVLALVGAGVVLMSGWTWRRRGYALLIVVAFLGVMKVAVPGLLGTFYGLFANSSSDPSVTYRTNRYPLIIDEIAKHVWLGRGMGTWYFPKHFAFDNQYLMTLVSVGVIGLAAFVGLSLAAAYAAIRAWLLMSDPDRRELCLALVACLAAPMLGSATFDLLAFTTATGLMFVLLGATGALLRLARGSATEELACHGCGIAGALCVKALLTDSGRPLALGPATNGED
jgi:O-Antigen ligase